MEWEVHYLESQLNHSLNLSPIRLRKLKIIECRHSDLWNRFQAMVIQPNLIPKQLKKNLFYRTKALIYQVQQMSRSQVLIKGLRIIHLQRVDKQMLHQLVWVALVCLQAWIKCPKQKHRVSQNLLLLLSKPICSKFQHIVANHFKKNPRKSPNKNHNPRQPRSKPRNKRIATCST